MSELFISSVRANNLLEVTKCLARGCDANTKDQWGWTAMMLACFAGYSDIMSGMLYQYKHLHEGLVEGPQCSKCPKKFANKSLLNRHKRRIHGDKKKE